MNPKLRVMQIIPDLGIGGAEIMVENLSIELNKREIDLKIISLYSHNSAITERLEKNNVQIIYLNKKLGVDWKIAVRLYRLMMEFKPDVVHTHLYAASYGIAASIFAKVPVKIHTIHNVATKEFKKINRIINRIFYHYYGVIPVSISPLIKQTVQKEYNLAENSVAMIYNGIDLKRCLPKENYAFNKDRIDIIHVGSFKEQKNHVGLLRSFKMVYDQYPNANLILIGSGELEEQVENCIKNLELGENVELLGLRADVYSFLNAADIFVFPSLWEGMPISLIEAMATGLPILATRVGGIPDMIENNISGLIVDVKDDDVSRALIQLIENRTLREQLGYQARIAALRFTSNKMATEYADLYNYNRISKLNRSLMKRRK